MLNALDLVVRRKVSQSSHEVGNFVNIETFSDLQERDWKLEIRDLLNEESNQIPPTHHSIIDKVIVAHQQHVVVQILHPTDECSHFSTRQQITVWSQTSAAFLQVPLCWAVRGEEIVLRITTWRESNSLYKTQLLKTFICISHSPKIYSPSGDWMAFVANREDTTLLGVDPEHFDSLCVRHQAQAAKRIPIQWQGEEADVFVCREDKKFRWKIEAWVLLHR